MNYCKTLILIFLSFVTFLKSETVYRVPIQSTIDLGLPNYIERSIEEAVNDNADAIIFDLNTFGGRVDGATQIKDEILNSPILTVAFINKRAISAGALISLSCDKIYMTSGGIIGKVDRVMEDDRIELIIADNVKVQVIKNTIQSHLKKEVKK